MNEQHHYDPVKCLRDEVERFKKTNMFTPMYVTGFYLQAACVLDELEMAKKEIEILKRKLDRKFTCFLCEDGNTPLYCLNCANELLETSIKPNEKHTET